MQGKVQKKKLDSSCSVRRAELGGTPERRVKLMRLFGICQSTQLQPLDNLVLVNEREIANALTDRKIGNDMSALWEVVLL